MAAKTGKPTAGKGGGRTKSGAGAAMAERSKDAGKQSFGKAAPKAVKPATAAKPAARSRTAAPDEPSIAGRVLRKVKETASGAVARAASVIGKDGRKA